MNILVIMSDEHSHQAMGASGHPLVRTPNLDKLARQGTLFTQCYTNSPLCTPARSCLFTGQYVHRLGTWDNSTPYDGRRNGIPHTLYEHGREIVCFGKLDLHPDGCYPGLVSAQPGMRSRPDVGAYFRESLQSRPNVEERYSRIGIRSGDCYDDRVRDDAVRWLQSKTPSDEPWMLYVGFHHPHFPFLVKPEYWDMYNGEVNTIPDAAKPPYRPLNEPLRAMRTHFNADATDEETVRQFHVGYYSLLSELDDNIGAILSALDEQGLTDNTLIIYTSDHGEQLGNHGMWFKCCMFEESVRIPLIVKGPGVQPGASNDTLLSLVDLYPTLCDAWQLPAPDHVQGISWMNLARGEPDAERNDFVFGEYHAHGMPVGMFMIRWRHYKYVYYTGYRPQLFDLNEDPEEMHDLCQGAGASLQTMQPVLAECERRLRQVCDPEAVDRRAKAFQDKRKQLLGITTFTQPDASSHHQGELKPYPVSHPEYVKL